MDLGTGEHIYLTSIKYIKKSLRLVTYALKTLVLSLISFRTGEIFSSISQEGKGHKRTLPGNLPS